MKELRKPQENIYRLLGNGKKEPGKEYRKSALFLGELFPDGAVIYHTLLKSIAFISKEGYEALLAGKEPEDEMEKEYFYSHYFFVPKETDEQKNVREIRGLLALMNQKNKALNSFTILPTTDCNARCFYCYEAGCEKLSMSMKTAEDVATYIMKKCPEKKLIQLNWFGGEPLYNVAAIDKITETIKQAGRTYSSIMVSNGYLFDEDMIQRAKTEWNLKSVQITLDGTEPVYNERKNFIYEGGSAFQRVFSNIKSLERAEIKVDVRLNMDGQNAEDLRALLSTLEKEFTQSKFVRVYIHLLYQVSGAGSEAYEEFFRLRREITEKGVLPVGSLRQGMKMNRCMADSDEGVVILPDGRLFRCEHFNETLPSFGSIYSEEEDKEILKKWHMYFDDLPECKECFYYPDCLRLQHCPEEDGTCFEEQRILKREMYLEGIRKEYEKMKEED